MKKSIALAIAPLALVAFTGCGATDTGEPQAPATTTPASQQPQDEPLQAETEPDDQMGQADSVQGARAVQDGVATFAYGDDATYPGGQGLKVSYVEETTLTEYGAAECGAGDAVSVYKITVKNGTGARWEPWEDMMLAASYVDDSTDEALEASDVFDDYGNKSLDGGQSLPALMSGKSGSSYVGFCHPGGSADSVQVYGSFYDEYGDPAGDALWMTADSIEG